LLRTEVLQHEVSLSALNGQPQGLPLHEMIEMKDKLKLVKNLQEKRNYRRKEGLFVVEGPHLVEEAGERVKFFFYYENLPIVAQLEEQGSIGYKLSRKQFEEISQVETPQGILAVVRGLECSLTDLLKGKETRIVFCVGVQDPGNLGTIIRSADALGASGVILSKGTVDLYNPKVIRATQGSIFHLPIALAEDDLETIGKLKRENVKIIGTAASGPTNVFAADLSGPVAILVGNEGTGLPAEIMGRSDVLARVPIAGKAESLNVGIAAAILLYEIMRQCKTK
jgi:TrmH family RNA methyltransferase